MMFFRMVFLFLVSVGLFATTPFANIPWGISPGAVKIKLAEKGFVPDVSTGTNAYIGTFMGVKTQVLTFYRGGGVQKIVLNMLTDDNAAITTYRDIRNVFIKKLGDPDTSVVKYDYPYSKEDGQDLQAIRAGKLTVFTMWPDSAANNSGIVVSIEKKLTVEITYETQVWAAAIAKERESQADLL